MTFKPSNADDLLIDLPDLESDLLEETIYDEVESYYSDDLLDLVQS
jgi:hypothetical protein